MLNPNLASIMPQAVGAWCEQAGHEVRICYPGSEDFSRELRGDTDILFIGAFTRAALTAYAISNLYRRRGAVTGLGGPHARSYPQDAAHYFDYVLGLRTRKSWRRYCTTVLLTGQSAASSVPPDSPWVIKHFLLGWAATPPSRSPSSSLSVPLSPPAVKILLFAA